MLELDTHQKEAVEKLHNGMILRGGVGTGKSRTAIGYYLKREAPRDVYVITTAKKRNDLDWEKEFAAAGIGKARNATVAGVLSVDSWNNLGRYRDVSGCFFIFDEQRLVGSGEWSKYFLKIAGKNRWILLTATPGDTWMDYVSIFVANGFYKNRTEFKRDHVVYSPYTKFPKIDHYINVGRLLKLRDSILVEMHYKRHTTRYPINIEVEYDQELFKKVMKDRWHVFENRPLQNVAELFHVMRRVVNSDLSRLNAVKSLLLWSHPKLIVFYNFDYELEILRSLNNTIIEEGGAIWSKSVPMMNSNESATKSQSNRTMMTKASHLATTINTHSPTPALLHTNQSPQKVSEIDGDGEGHNKWPIQKHANTTSFMPELATDSKFSSTAGVVKLGSHPSRSPRRTIDMTSFSTSGFMSQPTQNIERETTGTTKKTDESSNSYSTSTPTVTSGIPSTPPFSTQSVEVAEWNGHKHQPIPDADSWVYLVQYTAGAEGWNCVETDAMVFYSLPYSYRIFHQAHGRIDRLNTPYSDLYYYTLKSKSLIDYAINRSLTVKQNFNEKRFSEESRLRNQFEKREE